MLDQIDVEGVDLVRLELRLQLVVHLHDRHPRRREAEALRHALDVRIDGQRGPSEGEQQHDRRRLRPHARQRAQPRLRLIHRQRLEEAELVAGGLLADLGEQCLDARRLRRRKPAGPDRVLDLGRGRVDHLVPAPEALEQAVEGVPGVVIRGVLGEQRQHQLGDRVVVRPRIDAPVRLAEDRDQLGGPPLRSRHHVSSGDPSADGHRSARARRRMVALRRDRARRGTEVRA